MRHENFLSVRSRIRKEMEKDGKGEAGIENRGKGILSPFFPHSIHSCLALKLVCHIL